MRKICLSGVISLFILAGLLLLTPTATADENQADKQRRSPEKSPQPMKIYRLEFTVDELVEGKRVNTRTFSMMMKEGETNRVRMGTKFLISSSGTEAKFTDLGMKFDCKIEERDELILLDGKLDLNDPVVAEDGKSNPTMIRNLQAEIETAFPLDKNTVLGVYDDSSSKRRYELRATVTRIKTMTANQ